jgi:hypothetical protein
MKNKKWFLLTSNENWADEHDVPALAVMDEKRYEKWSNTKLSIYASLGNGGEDFMEDEQGLTGKELEESGAVEKMEVSEEFAKTFEKADLESLSLSSIFDGDEHDEDEDEDDIDEDDIDEDDEAE